MLQEIETQTIALSSAAAEAVRAVIEQRSLEGYALRVFVSGGGGCRGVNFGMALDNVFRENDFVFDSAGVKMVVDDMSIEYLRGAKVEYVNDPQHGAGFVVDSPLAAQGGSCACGSEGGGGCGCDGGSCGCGGGEAHEHHHSNN